VRGVVGSVAQTSSEQAIDLYRRYYSKLLWYGDSGVLGTEHKQSLNIRFDTEVVECGYVSRLIEQISYTQPPGGRQYGCIISIPWFGEHTDFFFDKLVEAVGLVGPGYGLFRIFLGGGDIQVLKQKLEGLDFCSVEKFGDQYVQALCSSRTALIFGGYNSLVDVLSIGIPTLVVMRDMQDKEQQVHLEALTRSPGIKFSTVMENDCSVEQIYRELGELMKTGLDPFQISIDLGGSEKAAGTLASML